MGWGSRALGGKVIGAIREGVRAKGWGGWEAFTSRILFNAHFECFHSQLHCRSSAIKTQTIRKLSRLSRVIYRMFRKCSRCMDSRIFPGSPETFPVWNLSLQFFLYSLETPYCLGGFWVCFTAIAEQFILSGSHYTSSIPLLQLRHHFALYCVRRNQFCHRNVFLHPVFCTTPHLQCFRAFLHMTQSQML